MQIIFVLGIYNIETPVYKVEKWVAMSFYYVFSMMEIYLDGLLPKDVTPVC